MSEPPRDRSEYWVRFVCAFLVFGFLAALVLLRTVDSVGLALGIGIWVVAVVTISHFAARVGDEAWRELIGSLRWW